MDKAGETSSQPALMRSAYNFLAVVLDSSIITYGGDSGSSYYWELSSGWFDNGEAVYFMIVDTGSGILLIVPQTRKS